MVTKPTPKKEVPAKADPQAKLQEAEARLKAALDRHDAVVSALSRLRASPQEKRAAQAAGKQVEHELREARRLLEEAQSAASQK
jgi:hypothetical protein